MILPAGVWLAIGGCGNYSVYQVVDQVGCPLAKGSSKAYAGALYTVPSGSRQLMWVGDKELQRLTLDGFVELGLEWCRCGVVAARADNEISGRRSCGLLTVELRW